MKTVNYSRSMYVLGYMAMEHGIKCHTVPDSVPGSRFSSRFSSRFDKLDNNCIIHDTKKNTMLFDISTTKIQSSHHKISFLEFSKFSEKLQIYVNTLALQTIISISTNPPGQEVMQKLFLFLFDISTSKMQSSHHKISFLEFSKFSEKLQRYVNQLALQNIISSFNNPLSPPGQEVM